MNGELAKRLAALEHRVESLETEIRLMREAIQRLGEQLGVLIQQNGRKR